MSDPPWSFHFVQEPVGSAFGISGIWSMESAWIRGMRMLTTATMGLAVATLAAASVDVSVATAAASHPASSHVTSVSFHGSAHHPEIVIRGHGFGSKPKPNLPISPEHAGAKYNAGCSTQKVVGNGNDGRDYSKHRLGVGWGKTAPHGFNAGVYVPGSYLDCIGLKVVSYSSTRVVLRPGCQYAHYAKLKVGDKFWISVNGAHARGTVHY